MQVALFSFIFLTLLVLFLFFFFFNDTATTEIYTLSLLDALPISSRVSCCTCSSRVRGSARSACPPCRSPNARQSARRDRKSTRLNSSHSQISYAVFCLKKKKNITRL